MRLVGESDPEEYNVDPVAYVDGDGDVRIKMDTDTEDKECIVLPTGSDGPIIRESSMWNPYSGNVLMFFFPGDTLSIEF